MSVKVMGEVYEAALKPGPKATMVAMADRVNHDGTGMRYAVDTLAWMTGHDRRTVQRHFRDFERRGLLVLEHPGDNRSPRTYRIDVDALKALPRAKDAAQKAAGKIRGGTTPPQAPAPVGGDKSDIQGRQILQPGVTNLTSGGGTMPPNPTTDPTTDPTTGPVPTPPQAAAGETQATNSPAAEPNGFDAFWLAYPRKKNKGDAEKVWKQIKPNAEARAAMLAAIAWQRETWDWRKHNGAYVPHPAKWLRAKGWLDERPTDAGRPAQTAAAPPVKGCPTCDGPLQPVRWGRNFAASVCPRCTPNHPGLLAEAKPQAQGVR